LLAATLYQKIMIGTTSFGISDQLAICTTPHAGNAGMLLHVNGKFTMETFKPSLCCTVSHYTGLHCQFRGVDQGTKVFVYGFKVKICYDKPIYLSDPSSQM
jgi:hypothetical protein